MTDWLLRRSTRDLQVHAFTSEQNEKTWEAACQHSLPAELAAETDERTPTCRVCLVAFGDTLADGMLERSAAAAEQQRAELNGS